MKQTDFRQEYDEHWCKSHIFAFESRRVARNNVLALCDDLNDSEDLYEVRAIMNRIIRAWRDQEICWGEFKRTLVAKLMEMVDVISNSPHIMINFDDLDEVALSREVLRLFREVLGDDLELEFNMDCSRDEELAWALVGADDEDFPPP